ncbi:hypothetical protein HPB52_013148 [Rhipicephalus sanguineus]|uniref:PHD-type domain-containing protein n=1 Tax=Rhipicephalus sanguineus TaxID=34632 RepID=A0A9D4SUG3_RHISA|nr:hypothetical protein HPB52_013148 [Rhipicephalus sanguineus]
MNAGLSLRLSSYAQNLNASAKERYIKKVELCGGVDPLSLTSNETAFDLALVPKVELSDIKDYLVHATSFITHEQLKAKKSLESHNYLTSGFVQEPQLRRHGEHIIARTKVNHSQAISSQPLEPWLLVKQDGMVEAAHCTCMAGLGEACSHIANSHLERIFVDADFYEGVVTRSKAFFTMVLLSELLFKTWTSPESENVLGNVLGDTSDDEALQYCYCGGPESGDMVECSGQDCKGKWFHFGCANLKRRPKAKAWFCRDCKPRKK